jgi:hypothetical protein
MYNEGLRNTQLDITSYNVVRSSNHCRRSHLTRCKMHRSFLWTVKNISFASLPTMTSKRRQTSSNKCCKCHLENTVITHPDEYKNAIKAAREKYPDVMITGTSDGRSFTYTKCCISNDVRQLTLLTKNRSAN